MFHQTDIKKKKHTQKAQTECWVEPTTSRFHHISLSNISALSSAKWLHYTKMWRTVRIHWQCSHWGGKSLLNMCEWIRWVRPMRIRHKTTSSFLQYFSSQPVLHDWCNKGCGMCYPVYGMMHIKVPLLLIGKSSPCGGSGFPLSLSEWSFTICPTPYNRK